MRKSVYLDSTILNYLIDRIVRKMEKEGGYRLKYAKIKPSKPKPLILED